MKRASAVGAAALTLGLAAAVTATAGPILLGETIETTYYFPDTSTIYPPGAPTNSVVGGGVELLNFAAFVDIDFSDTNILITARRDAGINAVTFDGFRFHDVLGTIPAFASVSINPATDYAGLDASRITFDGDNIWLNVVGLAGLNGQVISLDVTAVPEPTSVVTLGAGLLLAAYQRRRHRRGRPRQAARQP